MKRILVTGGSRGLGLAICRMLVEEDYHVITTARSASPELNRLRKKAGGQLEFIAANLIQAEEAAAVAKSSRLLDGVDGFIGNAGAPGDGLLTFRSVRQIDRVIRLNLTANILLAREAIKGMIDRGGSLIFISSVAARTGLAGLSVYSAAKSGLLAFSQCVAREYGSRGIRSNCILPGFLKTQMSGSLDLAQRARIAKRTALGRLGEARDVVGAVAFLLSDAARYMTGAELVVDGGFTI